MTDNGTKIMRKLRREIFVGMSVLIVCGLGTARCINPRLLDGGTETHKEKTEKKTKKEVRKERKAVKKAQKEEEKAEKKSLKEEPEKAPELEPEPEPEERDGRIGLWFDYIVPQFKDVDGNPVHTRIYSVSSYAQAFPDLQDVQYEAALRWGVKPVANRQEAEARKDELVFVGSNPYYSIDARMNYSIPYLVPRAGDLLQKISRNFLDSLAMKGIPLHTLLVTSVLRTEEDVHRLRQTNTNASETSCHRFGTTFDISYNRFNVVGNAGNAVGNDSLKWVLSEVLRDLREQEYCYVKHEVKQGCFHITVR